MTQYRVHNFAAGAAKDVVRGLVLEVPGGQVPLPTRNVPRRREDVQVGPEAAGDDRRLPPFGEGESGWDNMWPGVELFLGPKVLCASF